jgi:phosphatidylglycerol:prolipoprotein diacylglycerol transferase
LPWGVDLWGVTRHPSQIYELIASFLIFALIGFRKTDSPPGVAFVTFAALTAASRLLLEAFRGDSTLILGGLRLAQVIAWIVLAVALFASESIRTMEKAD